jgi:catechol 2,3-dioxygenase-like lactoylglutathione lyase family enzyme
MTATQGIGRLWKPVVNVTDLDEGEKFWCALTGLSVRGRHGDESGEVFSILVNAEDPADPIWMLLQLVPAVQTTWVGGTHCDLKVEDVAEAVRQTEEIGGVTIREPELYPDPRNPLLEWAVMRDPFGNEFCFVKGPLAT